MSDQLSVVGGQLPVRCGCGGEARVVKHEYYMCSPTYGVTCYKCGTATNQGFDTESEAIEAWNRAMGAKDINVPNKFATDTNVGDKERTAKVIEHDASVTDTDGYKYHRSEYLCGACKKKVIGGDEYCSHCGCRLDWNEDIPMEYFENGGI